MGKYTKPQIVQLLKSKGYTQADVSRINQCSRANVSMTLSGKQKSASIMETISLIAGHNVALGTDTWLVRQLKNVKFRLSIKIDKLKKIFGRRQ